MGKAKRRRDLTQGPPDKRSTKHNCEPKKDGRHAVSMPQVAFRSTKILLLGCVTVLYLPILVILFVLAAIMNGFRFAPLQTPDLNQVTRFIGYAIMCKEDIGVATRCDICLTIVQHTFYKCFTAGCFLFDEILYGRQLNAVSVDEPLFVLSAYRSASTEMARTLAKDTDQFICPTAIMCAFPYLWLWNLITWIGFEGFTKEELNRYLNKNIGEESLERRGNANDHFAIDTFDGFFLSSHLNGLAFHLGAEVIIKEFNASKFEEHNKELFDEEFVKVVDRLARKTLYFNNGDLSIPNNKRFLLKGHFLSSAVALKMKYPSARFLTILRDPLERLKSAINHTAVNSTIWLGQAPRWDWLSTAFEQIELEYCKREMTWYNFFSEDDRRQCLAVTFNNFINDFNGTMMYIYTSLLDGKIMPEFKAPPKTMKKYAVDKSLEELGVNEEILRMQLAAYYVWMKKESSKFASKKRDKYQ